jgi:lipopolysaccharide export system protein LptC
VDFVNLAVTAHFDPAMVRPREEAERRRRRKAFAAARRHTRLVLPAAGLLSIAGLIVLARFSFPGDLDLSAASLSVTRNSIIMENPHLIGFDGDRRQYSVSADRAIQALMRPDEVRLEAIEARIVAVGQGPTTITAEAGEYDHGKSTLRLTGAIAVNSAEGYSLNMTDADFDFAGETMSTANPVKVTYEDSEITAGRLSVNGGGDTILFEGNVRTTLMPPKRRSATTNAPSEQN